MASSKKGSLNAGYCWEQDLLRDFEPGYMLIAIGRYIGFRRDCRKRPPSPSFKGSEASALCFTSDWGKGSVSRGCVGAASYPETTTAFLHAMRS